MSTELQTTQGGQIKPVDALRMQLDARRDEFQKALPSHITYDKFQRTVITAVLVDPTLLQADRASFMLACVLCAQDGLLPDKQQAAFVIFNKNSKDKASGQWKKERLVQYMPMYRGILKKVRQSGELAAISAHVVYARDFFEYILGDEEKIIHKPTTDIERGEVVAAYAIAHLKDGSVMREIMTVADIEKVRRSSKAAFDKDGKPIEGAPWTAWYEEMAKKTVFRRLAKWLPQQIEIDSFVHDRTMDIVESVEPEKPVFVSDGGEIVDAETGEVVNETPQIENNKPVFLDDQGFPADRPATLSGLLLPENDEVAP